MKLAASIAILLALSGYGKAQTVTTYSSRQENLTIFVPCVNSGKGENITFKGKVYPILQTVNVNEIKHGVLVYNSADLIGTGQVTGKTYTSVISNQSTFSNQDSYSDGDFQFTINANINSPSDHVLYHDVREDVVTNMGNNMTVIPEQTVCK